MHLLHVNVSRTHALKMKKYFLLGNLLKERILFYDKVIP